MEDRELTAEERERIAEAEATALRLLFRQTRSAPGRTGMNSKYSPVILGVLLVPLILVGLIWLVDVIF